jgi:hypothetical protein
VLVQVAEVELVPGERHATANPGKLIGAEA